MGLKIDNLNFSYKNSLIFDNCTLDIKDGSKTVIVGLNGCGKSTLFKIISGEIKHDIKINSDFKNVFYLPQNIYYPKNITAFDYLASIFFKKSYTWFIDKDQTEKINQALLKMGLIEKKDITVDKLSGGEFQKLNLAFALLLQSDLLLLDEPISNLDLINQKEVLDIIKNLNATCVTIIHDLNFAVQLGDNFIGISKNHKIIQAPKEEFFTPDNLKEIFEMDFKVIKDDKKYFIQINS